MSESDVPTVPATPKPIRLRRRFDPRYVEAITVPHATGGSQTFRLKPAAYPFVANLARGGNTREGIRLALGLGTTSWKRLQAEDPQLVDALLAGNAGLEIELTTTILNEVRKGNWVAALALGKTRLGWRDSGPTDPNASTAPTVNIQINAPLSADEFVKVVGPLPPEPEAK